MLAVIYWEINGVSGNGSPIHISNAVAWVRAMNDKYGPGTHWVVPCEVGYA